MGSSSPTQRLEKHTCTHRDLLSKSYGVGIMRLTLGTAASRRAAFSSIFHGFEFFRFDGESCSTRRR
jgi:hypothetical protein